MASLYKRIFDTWSDLSSFLTARGFTVSNNKITYNQTPNSALCYWSYNSSGTVNFINSQGERVFRHDLTDFVGRKKCACIFIQLAEDGFVLFLSPVEPTYSITDLTFCCTNNYHQEQHPAEEEGDNPPPPEIVDDSNPLENGLVIATPTDEDDRWHFLWRDKTPDETVYKWSGEGEQRTEVVDYTVDNFNFDVDDSRGHITVGVEIPHTKMMVAPLTVTLTKAYLNQGMWSKHIYVQVLGEIDPPGNIFKINGQKFISFSDNQVWRCPVFKLPPTEVVENVHTSTEQYYPTKTYKVGEYCIYEGLLWRCIRKVATPMVFDQTYWVVTTVDTELHNS